MIKFKNTFNYQYYDKRTFRKFLENFKDAEIVKKRKGKYWHRYLNIPIGFDIEVSSFYNAIKEKCSLMYVWQVCINGIVWIGRDYLEFYSMLIDFQEILRLGYLRKVVFYVHNLAYEFNCLRHYLDIIEYFGLDNRKPLYAVDKRGVEFRCSYQLSGYSLEYLGSNMLHKYHVEKAVGDLDYSLIRTPNTPLTRKEIGYIVNDARIVCNYIEELLEGGESIADIPFTKTGRVRRAFINNCTRKERNKLNRGYIQLMQQCVIETLEEEQELEEAFAGGFTHSNPYNTNKTFLRSKGKGVLPADICSDYPFIMTTCKFPMSKATKRDTMTLEEYRWHISVKHHIIARFTFNNISSTFLYDFYISKSKCRNMTDCIESNGRVVSGSFDITLTEVDFDIIEKTYKWDNLSITDCLIYTSAYLPVAYVETILDFYSAKTTLKGISDREIEYQQKKEMLNSSYGMMVTKILRPRYSYDDDYYIEDIDGLTELGRYNTKKDRTTYYPWGVYVTAHARHKLWTEAILPLAERYIYSDTDSCYAMDSPEVREHFEKINNDIMDKLRYISQIRGIELSKFQPATVKGDIKPLGVWEIGSIEDFKTLGAKRYITRDEEGYHLTVAGLPKKTVDYIVDHGGFDFFTNKMKVPAEYSGRNVVAYIDNPRKGIIADYLGNEYKYDVRCGVHMESTAYNMNMYIKFIEFLKGLKV